MNNKKHIFREFLGRILDSNDAQSSKRFITLIVTALFILTNLVILFFCSYVIVYSVKGKVEESLLKVLTEIIYWQAMIILGGLGFVTITSLGQSIVEKAKAIGAANVATGTPTSDTMNVDTMNIGKSDTDLDPKKQ